MCGMNYLVHNNMFYMPAIYNDYIVMKSIKDIKVTVC